MFAAAFAPETEKNFMNACSVGMDASVCRCTLTKIEKQYTEAQFKNIDSQLSHGKKAPAYETFVQKASAECKAEASQGSAAGAVAGSQVSSQDAAMMQMMVGMFAESFEPECEDALNPYFGVSEGKKACSCFLEKTKNTETVAKLITLSTQGDAGEEQMMDLLWDVGAICIPEKYTPQMENNIVKQCANGDSEISKNLSQKVPNSKASEKDCRCVLKEIEKTYTPRDLVKAAMNADESLVLYVTAATARCAEK